MKRFDRDTYRRNLKDVSQSVSDDPFKIETYLRGAFDIANSFNTDEQASGILDKNDLIQECNYIMCRAWENIDWESVRESKNPQAIIWSYLKKTIKLQVRDRVHNQKDGVRNTI